VLVRDASEIHRARSPTERASQLQPRSSSTWYEATQGLSDHPPSRVVVRVGERAAPAAVVHSVRMTVLRGSGRLAQPIRYSTVSETASSGAAGSVGTDVGSLTAGPAPGAVGGSLFGTIIGTA
jgi:hypothetical protein